MNQSPRCRLIFRSIILFGLALLLPPQTARADDDPRRFKTIEVVYTENTWWLAYWQNDVVACQISVDHDQQPTHADIFNQCGEKIYDQWSVSVPCDKADSSKSETCSGMYLLPIGSEQKHKEMEIELPTPRVWTALQNCISVRGTELCAGIPNLVIIAYEPLPNEKIEKIQGTVNGIPFMCFGDTCELPLQETTEDGMPIEFWADSSFGDSTAKYQGRIRVAESTQDIPYTAGWKIDIVSNKDDFNTLTGCAEIWQSFPPMGTPPDWLSNPHYSLQLETNEPYTYLAGQLIQLGYVDTSECEYYGLLSNGFASPCGLEKSRTAVRLWQNTFDTYIIQAAQAKGIPSQLLKRIFAQESQFWPATARHLYLEYGPGHINELGADTTLFWNRDFYDQFCPLILDRKQCQRGYTKLDDWSQVLLRGAFLADLEIELPFRDQPIDEAQAQASVSLFAETLLGNCSQVGQIISYEMERVPGEIVSYEDLWRFTLVNYHAGSGCLAKAVIEVSDQHLPLTWENIARELAWVCPNALEYVDGIVY